MQSRLDELPNSFHVEAIALKMPATTKKASAQKAVENPVEKNKQQDHIAERQTT